MTPLHPWAIWIGAAAVALPVAVHLLTRPRPVRMPLSTLRFVREAIRQRRARHRLRDWLILLLRTCAVALLALAIARPQLSGESFLSRDTRSDTVRVVVVDVSQSMAATHQGVRAIDRARASAMEYLEYRPGLKANLILAGAAASATFESPSTNFETLREELANCQPRAHESDVASAFELASRMLADQADNDEVSRELIVVSDFQRTNWATAPFDKIPEGTKIHMESIAPAATPDNVAILSAVAEPASAQTGGVIVRTDVANYSKSTRPVDLEVTLGESTHRVKGSCSAGGTTTLAIEIATRQSGWQWGEVRLAGVDDALTADNRRPFVVKMRNRPTFVIITRQRDNQRSSSHYLECGLVPDADLGEQASAELIRLAPGDIDAGSLAPADVVFVDHCGKLDDDQIRVLGGVLRRGCPVVYVAAEAIDATNLDQLAELGGGPQLPVRFRPPTSGRTRSQAKVSVSEDPSSPFAVFGDRTTVVAQSLRFGGGLISDAPRTGREDEIAARYGDGSACLVLTSSEAGCLAVLNADLMQSNVWQGEVFVPLLDELIKQMLDRNRQDPSFTSGELLVSNLAPEAGVAAELEIVGAEDIADESDADLGSLDDQGANVVWTWRQAGEPGVFRIERKGETVHAAAVTLSPRESDLSGLPRETITDRLASGRDVSYRSAISRTEQRDTAWQWLLTGCVFCLLAELGTMIVMRN
jgi:hypothetical protein